MTYQFRDAKRSEAKPQKRKLHERLCPNCGTCFLTTTPATQLCSKRCVWEVSKGPEYNARIARQSVQKRADKRRGTGTKWYIKRDGRHEHRTVAEQKLGRDLLPKEVVHHIDGNKHNNDPANLMIMTQGEHMREHGLGIPGLAPNWMRKRQ